MQQVVVEYSSRSSKAINNIVSLMLKRRQRVPVVLYHALLPEGVGASRWWSKSGHSYLAYACRGVIPSPTVGDLTCAGDLTRFALTLHGLLL